MLDRLPSELIAGDTWSWSRGFADYPAPTWTATVYFENADGSFSAAASVSGTEHAFTITAATTAAQKPGRYKWSVRVTSAGVSATVETGWIEVLADPAATGKHDPRSWARRTLEAVEAFLEGNASTAQSSMSVGGRSISRWSLTELTDWRGKLRQEVRIEEQGANAGRGRDIKVRYGAP